MINHDWSKSTCDFIGGGAQHLVPGLVPARRSFGTGPHDGAVFLVYSNGWPVLGTERVEDHCFINTQTTAGRRMCFTPFLSWSFLNVWIINMKNSCTRITENWKLLHRVGGFQSLLCILVMDWTVVSKVWWSLCSEHYYSVSPAISLTPVSVSFFRRRLTHCLLSVSSWSDLG